MAKDLPSFIAQEGAKREGSIIREKNFIDANNYETVAYLKHLDVRNEPKMVLFENVPALNGQRSDFPMFYNPWVTRQYVADSLDMGEIKSGMEVSVEVARLEQQQGRVEIIGADKAPVKQVVLTGDKADLENSPYANAPKGRCRLLINNDLRDEGARERLLRHNVYQKQVS